MAIDIHTLAIITLNVSGLNAPIKRHRVADWTNKAKVYNMLPTTYPKWAKDTYKLNVRG